MKTINSNYALVTGASQGFGKFISFELARRKIHLVLVSLPNSGLKELSKFLELNFKVKVHCLEVDLSHVENFSKIRSYIEEHSIEVKYLVNNAGVLSRGLFESLDNDFIMKQIGVNVVAPTLLIKLLLENLKNNAPARILNISSMASFFALPKK